MENKGVTMAYEIVGILDADTTIALGGFNKKTRKDNPTQIEGYFLGSKETKGKFGPAKLHIFQTATGNVGVWGKTSMDKALTAAPLGAMTLVTFKGTRPTKQGNDAYIYEVRTDRTNTIDVSAYYDSNSISNSEVLSDDSYEDSEIEEEPVYVAPKAPATPSPIPSSARQSSTLDLLNKARNKSA